MRKMCNPKAILNVIAVIKLGIELIKSLKRKKNAKQKNTDEQKTCNCPCCNSSNAANMVDSKA